MTGRGVRGAQRPKGAERHRSNGVVVLGSINIDLVVEAPRLPASGETLRGRSFRAVPGGKGANQAVAAARLGSNVRLVGRVGGDAFGLDLVAALHTAGVDTTGVTIAEDAETGTALICVADNGENTIVTVRGANGGVGDQELRALDRALQGAHVLLVQLEIPLDVVEQAVRAARTAGLDVVLDPAPVTELPAGLLGEISWITPNETEAEALTGIAPDDDASAERTAAKLRSLGIDHAVVTLGERGCVYAGPGAAIHVAAPSVRAVDTVAAGDAFNGALAAAIVEGLEPEEALRRACTAGALACTKPGAQPSLPTRAELDARMTH